VAETRAFAGHPLIVKNKGGRPNPVVVEIAEQLEGQIIGWPSVKA